MFLQGGNPMQQQANLLFDRVRRAIMIQFNAMLDLLAVLFHDPPWHADDRRPGRHLMQHNGIGPDHGIVTNTKRAEDLGPGPNQHIVAKCRMPLLAFHDPCATEGDTMINGTVCADLSGLADDDACTVVNEQPSADLGARVNFDTGAKTAKLGYQARNKIKMAVKKPMRHPVIDQNMETWIKQSDLPGAFGGRIALGNRFCVRI